MYCWFLSTGYKFLQEIIKGFCKIKFPILGFLRFGEIIQEWVSNPIFSSMVKSGFIGSKAGIWILIQAHWVVFLIKLRNQVIIQLKEFI